MSLEIGPAQPDEWNAALLMLWHRDPPMRQQYRIDQFRQLFERGEIDAGGLWVIRHPGTVGTGYDRIVAVILAERMAGGGSSIWPAQALIPPASEQMVDHLTDVVCRWLVSHKATFVQSMIRTDDSESHDRLIRQQFAHLGRAWSLTLDLHEVPELSQPSPEIRITAIDPMHPDPRFLDAMRLSQEDSLDYPELDKVRTIESTLTAMRGQREGLSWWLAEYRGERAGVLLLSAATFSKGMELVYLGVVPAFRRRGIAWALLRHAADHAQSLDAQSLVLTVDGRNQPARDLYRRFGFRSYDVRSVFLRRLAESPA